MRPKTAIILVRPDQAEHHQTTWGGAFAAGLKKHGWRVDLRRIAGPRSDLLDMWSTRKQREIGIQRALGGQVCILERGYVGDRFKWTSVSFNGGLNGHADFYGPFDDGSRWQQHFAHLMHPWQTRPSGYALIMQQVPGDMSLEGADMPKFYGDAEGAYRPRMPIKVRPHPQAHPRRPGTLEHAATSLAQDLAGAQLAVTWNSNSGVDAVLAGVPTIAANPGSMAWDVTGHKLGEVPPTPDRTAWAHALAWKQWRVDEMASGACWEAVRHGVQ